MGNFGKKQYPDVKKKVFKERPKKVTMVAYPTI